MTLLIFSLPHVLPYYSYKSTIVFITITVYEITNRTTYSISMFNRSVNAVNTPNSYRSITLVRDHCCCSASDCTSAQHPYIANCLIYVHVCPINRYVSLPELCIRCISLLLYEEVYLTFPTDSEAS